MAFANPQPHRMNEFIVIDFETSGLSPEYERVIEIGAALVKDGEVKATVSQLLNPGFPIAPLITNLTGITNEMLSDQPAPEKAMPRLSEFLGQRPILAHNSGFDSKFLMAEMARIGLTVNNPFLCTLRLARRFIFGVDNYKLETLARHFNIPLERSHRALDDVLVTVQLWQFLEAEICQQLGVETLDHPLLHKLMHTPIRKVSRWVDKFRAEAEL